jgi:hypothetical protein
MHLDTRTNNQFNEREQARILRDFHPRTCTFLVNGRPISLRRVYHAQTGEEGFYHPILTPLIHFDLPELLVQLRRAEPTSTRMGILGLWTHKLRVCEPRSSMSHPGTRRANFNWRRRTVCPLTRGSLLIAKVNSARTYSRLAAARLASDPIPSRQISTLEATLGIGESSRAGSLNLLPPPSPTIGNLPQLGHLGSDTLVTRSAPQLGHSDLTNLIIRRALELEPSSWIWVNVIQLDLSSRVVLFGIPQQLNQASQVIRSLQELDPLAPPIRIPPQLEPPLGPPVAITRSANEAPHLTSTRPPSPKVKK